MQSVYSIMVITHHKFPQVVLLNLPSLLSEAWKKWLFKIEYISCFEPVYIHWYRRWIVHRSLIDKSLVYLGASKLLSELTMVH